MRAAWTARMVPAVRIVPAVRVVPAARVVRAMDKKVAPAIVDHPSIEQGTGPLGGRRPRLVRSPALSVRFDQGPQRGGLFFIRRALLLRRRQLRLRGLTRDLRRSGLLDSFVVRRLQRIAYRLFLADLRLQRCQILLDLLERNLVPGPERSRQRN